MVIASSEEVIVDFPKEGVRVRIPPQNGQDSQKKMLPKSVPSLPISKLSSNEDEFKPAKLVINVEVVDADDPLTILTDFDPAFEIRAKYTSSDLMQLEKAKTAYYQGGGAIGGKGEPVFQLGFWNGCRWVLFTKAKHNYRIEPNNPPHTGGVEIVDISKWGDPPIGHGP
jgi:hypothetical protein